MPTEVVQQKVYQAFKHYVPATSINYCFGLWMKYPFIFKIRKPRLSKAGDYSFNPVKNTHTITINNNLNPFGFLITYIHEVAHLVAFQEYGRKISPHGKEWKQTFSLLMEPMLISDVFPEDILKTALHHFQNPKASTAGDLALVRVLSKYDPDTNCIGILLDDIADGTIFSFRSKKYQKLEKRRTRILCAEYISGKKYLINKAAIVEPAES